MDIEKGEILYSGVYPGFDNRFRYFYYYYLFIFSFLFVYKYASSVKF